MIPILYLSDETAFQSNGLGRLSDIISCTVSEERNGPFEVEFQYPLTGIHYKDIVEGRIISCTHDESHQRQPFRIYRRSAPIDGVVTFNARHLCYDLINVILEPYTATDLSSALNGFTTHAMTGNPFSFWTDKSNVQATFTVDTPAPVWEKLGGVRGSILDVYGTGEWKLDNWTARLYLHRGSDKDVTIRYGKNLVSIEHTVESDDTYNAVVPFWKDPETGEVVYGGVVVALNAPALLEAWTTDQNVIVTDDNNNELDFAFIKQKPIAVDFSEKFEEQPSVDDLTEEAEAYLSRNRPWIPRENLKVDFVALWQTPEYEQYAVLQRINLCDTVTVQYPALGVDSKAKVIKTVYNVLTERYDEIELGDASASYASMITEAATLEAESLIQEQTSAMQTAIKHATDLITGGLGGHIVYRYDGNGRPTEMLVMDTEDEATAVNVLRINVNGIGFSHDGVNGPFNTAWTLDGRFVADFITTGVLDATLIKTGTLDGTNFICVNLNAVNASISGSLTTKEDDNNYIYVDSGQIQAVANGDQSLRIGSYQQNNEIVGNSLQLTDANGQMRGNLYINTVQDASGLSFYNSAGVRTIALYNNPSYSEASYLRLFDTSSPNDTHFTSAPNGLWFYDPSGTGGPSGGISAMITSANGIYTDNEIVCKGNLFAQADAYVYGALVVYGQKNRAVDTKDGKRLLYAVESAEPYFTDIGEGTIGDDGKAVIKIDSIFRQTVDLEGYQVFIQKYGNGDCWVERQKSQFTVHGTPGLSFGWELKAHQIDHNGKRLDKYEVKNEDY